MKRPSIYDLYEGTVFRPPSEANSLILQVTIGCSYNRCTFCDTYGDKEFRIKSFEDLKRDVELVLPYYKNANKIFLADGNALMLSTEQLVQTLEYLYEQFPKLERIGIYGGPGDILKKPEDDLKL
ncbi:MAG: radical SAM protein, partial [Thermoplasmata archaeon]|nr:radical SAM protein [Thermoplasmata archaeon]